MRRVICALLLVTLPSASFGQSVTSSAAAAKLPAPCTSLDGCSLELYRRGAVQQARRQAAEAALEACRAEKAAMPAVPSTVTLEYKTPTWVPWVVGISIAMSAVLGVYTVVKATEATDAIVGRR